MGINKAKSVLAVVIAMAFILAIIPGSAAASQEDPFSEINKRLAGISKEEKAILQNLFTLAQEITLLEAEEKKLASDITLLNGEIEALKTAIESSRQEYEKKKDSLKQVLKSYQKMGPGSYIEIILDSKDFSTFLQRMNILRDLANNTGELIDQLEASGKQLAEEEKRLEDRLAVLKDKQAASRAAIDKKLKLKEENENYLASLKGEKERYLEQLAAVQKVWNELKLMLSAAAKEFSRIIETGSLPADALKVTISFPEIRGAIEDKTINKLLEENSNLNPMSIAFHEGLAEISLPDMKLQLSGSFTIEEGHILRYKAAEGKFFGMPLSPGSIEELFSEGELVLNLEPLLAGSSIHSVEIKEGYIELISKLNLFLNLEGGGKND